MKTVLSIALLTAPMIAAVALLSACAGAGVTTPPLVICTDRLDPSVPVYLIMDESASLAWRGERYLDLVDARPPALYRVISFERIGEYEQHSPDTLDALRLQYVPLACGWRTL